MIAFSESDRFAAGVCSNGDAQCLYDSEWGMGWLGFDRQRQRMVEIHQPDFTGSRAAMAKKVLQERLAATRDLLHPGMVSVVEVDQDHEGDLFFVTEFVDGERLGSYLRRQHPISRRVGMCLMLQLAEVVGYLADYPRVLAAVRLDDFAVTLDRGRFVSLRLTDFGFDREETPVREKELAARWILWIGAMVGNIAQSRSFALSEVMEACPSPSTPLDNFVQKLMGRTGAAAMSELKRMKAVLMETAGLADGAGSRMRPEFRSLKTSAEVPQGPFLPLMCDDVALAKQLDSRYQWLEVIGRKESKEGYDWSCFRRTVSDLANDGRAEVSLLPPERLIDQSGTARLYEKMAHPYLKAHPNLIRTRAITCDPNFTMMVEDEFHGFSLASLVAQRGRITPTESVAILREIDGILTQLEGADFSILSIDPWQVWFHFDPPLVGEKMQSVLAQENFLQWPGYEMKLRVGPTTESLTQPEAGSWSHLLHRMGDLSLPSLALWLMEGDRFEWALCEGQAVAEPLSWNPQLDSFFQRVIQRYDVEDSNHRKLLVESLASMFAPTVPQEVETPLHLPLGSHLLNSQARVLEPTG